MVSEVGERHFLRPKRVTPDNSESLMDESSRSTKHVSAL